MNGAPILTIITLIPLIGGFMVVGVQNRKVVRGLALLFNSLTLALAIALWLTFDKTSGALQFVQKHDWIPSLGVQYFVGVDGLGLLMVLLTAIVTPMALLASGAGILPVGSNGQQPERHRQDACPTPTYYALILFLQAGLFGTFTAHLLGIGDQRTIDLDAVLFAQHRVELAQFAENAELAFFNVDLGMLFQDT